MISYLEGEIINKAKKHVVLLVGGVGYKIFASEGFLEKLDLHENAEVFTYLNVKEDALDLYGFEAESELELFELFLLVSGVGPKSALGLASLDSPGNIASAILNEDTAFLGSVSGVGKKTVQKMILELKDKVASLSFDVSSGDMSYDNQALEALESLGYNQRQAREALKQIPKEIDRVEDKIKEALKVLGNK